MYEIKIPFLNLEKIYHSGQQFSWTKINSNTYSIVDGDHYVEVVKANDANDVFRFSCSEEEFNAYWHNYFDMDTDYETIWSFAWNINVSNAYNDYLFEIIKYGYGIRILRQDPWQTIVTFMISQNNSMKRIRRSVDMLRERYGTNKGNYHAFPTSEQLLNADWNKYGCGYRTEYLQSLCHYSQLDLTFAQDLNHMITSALLERLKLFRGCGKKVSACIALYGYGRKDVVPIDTHIKKIFMEHFPKTPLHTSPLDPFNGCQGILQQWMFDYETKNNMEGVF